MSSKLLKGTFILTLGTYLSKILGLFYVIPFFSLVGQHGTALYQYGYVPYSLFISISTAGIPLAISKFISKYNSLGEYAVGRKLFKSGLLVMAITGLLSFIILYSIAPIIAEPIIADDDQISNIGDVVSVIRAISFALIIIPVMSLIRGYFQGHQSMGPSAVSQVIEQIVRIAFLLIGAYVVIHIMGGSVVQAVQVATFAAFIGAIGSLGVLIWYWYKRRPYLNEMLAHDKGTIQIDYKEMYKEILFSAFPFVVVGSANVMFQYVDQLTFNQAMANIGMADVTEQYLSVLNFNTHKIIMIPVSLAIAFSTTLVPLITDSFINGKIGELRKNISQTFQVLLFLTMPACFGISVLAEPIYVFFYGITEMTPHGVDVLRIYAPVAILFALFSVTAAILQGLNEQKFTVFSLLLGLLIKLVLNIPLIEAFETLGAVYATAIGYSIAIFINLIVIRKYAQYRYQLVFRRSLLILIFTIIMSGLVFFLYGMLSSFISIDTRVKGVIVALICAGIGAAVYFYLGWRSKLIQFLFPEQVNKLRKRFAKA